MNLAYKKVLGKFTKVLGFGKTPPHVGKNSQIMSFFFLKAYLRTCLMGFYSQHHASEKVGFGIWLGHHGQIWVFKFFCGVWKPNSKSHISAAWYLFMSKLFYLGFNIVLGTLSKKKTTLFGNFSQTSDPRPPPPPFWEPLIQKKIECLFCIIEPKEHFCSSKNSVLKGTFPKPCW